MHAIPAARYLARRKRQNLLLGLLALVALCMLLLGVSVGNGVVRLPLGLSEHELALFVRLRLPRVLMGALVGAGLAMSGTLAQAVLRNPLASPFTLGISSGAAFGAALAILLGGASQWGMAGNAFVFAALTAFAALGFARLRDSRPETLILGGVAIMFLFSAATSLLQYVATEYEVQAIVFWGFGNLGRVGWSELGMAAVMILLPVPFALKLSWDLNALLAGEETASSLGVNVRRLRIGGILAASLMAAGGYMLYRSHRFYRTGCPTYRTSCPWRRTPLPDSRCGVVWGVPCHLFRCARQKHLPSSDHTHRDFDLFSRRSFLLLAVDAERAESCLNSAICLLLIRQGGPSLRAFPSRFEAVGSVPFSVPTEPEKRRSSSCCWES